METIIINILLICSLVFLACLVATITINLIKKKGYSRIKYLKNYKKGRFVFVYIAVMMMNFANQLYNNGNHFIKNLTLAAKDTVDVVVLKINFNNVASFYDGNTLASVVITICYLLVFINVLLFIISLTYNRIWSMIRYLSNKSKDTINIIVGYNSNSMAIINSIKKQKRDGYLIVDSLNPALIDELLSQNTPYQHINLGNMTAFSKTMNSLDSKYHRNNVNVIINLEDEKKCLLAIKELSSLIVDQKVDFKVYVLASSENETAFQYYMQLTNGKIKFIETHMLVAYDFIDKYPLTKFMDERHIDYNNATIKDININVYLIGFGKTNRQIFLASVANNQFLTLDGKTLKNHLVNYYIYDREKSSTDKNLNHYYYRLENDEKYFEDHDNLFLSSPKLSKPANIIDRNATDINSAGFYKQLKEDLGKTKENDINYIIVSISSDADNIDMVEKLSDKVNEWNVYQSTKLFVKLKDHSIVDNGNYQLERTTFDKTKKAKVNIAGVDFTYDAISTTKSNKRNYYPFGNEKQIIYHIDSILNEKNEMIAKARNAIYNIEYNLQSYNDLVTAENVKSEISNVNQSWYRNLTVIQRESNVYAVLSLRSKLNLLGFDYVHANQTYNSDKYQEVDFSEYNQKYFGNSDAQIATKFAIEKANGEVVTKNIYQGKLTYKDCIRTTMAEQEHLRWNAYTISRGVVPSTRQEIISQPNNGKDYLVSRKHGNITTFAGLIEYRKLIAVKNFVIDKLKDSSVEDKSNYKAIASNILASQYQECELLFDKLPNEEKQRRLLNSDVIKYDFQLLDDLEFLFNMYDFKLLKIKK